jgi:small subunit ribosomal protein S3
VPLHTLRAEIDYGHSTSFTTHGTIGVKVWIYKGDALFPGRSTAAANARVAPGTPVGPALIPAAAIAAVAAPAAPAAPAAVPAAAPVPQAPGARAEGTAPAAGASAAPSAPVTGTN